MPTLNTRSKLKEALAAKIAAVREDVRQLLATHGEFKLGEITVEQAYGGMRGVKGLVTETSALDPQEGIRFRGYTIPDVQQRLPRARGSEQPLPEALFYLLLTGEIPTAEQTAEVTAAWRERETLPEHVKRTLDALPLDTHPMTQFSIGILAMQHESIFAQRYRDGMHKNEMWEPMLDDSMLLLGRLPLVAAYIYRRSYHKAKHVAPGERSLDWGANLAHLLKGVDEPEFQDMMRLYLTLHADHEGGNVSAHATHLVGSALSDPYLSLSAGMNGLAGPLHGLANQEVMRWIVGVKERLGTRLPTREQLTQLVWETLNAGQVVPGYGHGVLRATDPRYLAQQEFARKHLPDDENFKIVQMLFEIVPDILMKHGKAKNPWPNVDAHSGCLLVHYGVEEYDFYTVLFGVSRAMGVLASLVWDRALMLPLERPKSITTEWVQKAVLKG
ncbi:MAG TPA: citrate (Si)-synthase, eukaryotic [Candidatus Polarisedimenticolaceae bacterium]|nr:citrate (Si)-synthase, eukaryotic [Candidatus Polarisedimenticolaceae bacterium]